MTLLKITTLAGVALIALVNAPPARADATAYQGIVNLRADGRDFVVTHHHDWSGATRDSRYKMITTHQDPFLGDNDYAYLEWRTRADGRLVRRQPSPALTWLGVVGSSEYVVGLSNIMLDNAYQLVVLDRNGNLLLKRHIAPEVACLTPSRYRELLALYRDRFAWLEGRVWASDGMVYIDFLSMDMPRRLGQLWKALYPAKCGSPLSPNFSESVTNHVYWYLEENPSPEVIEFSGLPSVLQVSDPKGERVSIPFSLELPSE